ncbi:MULTISPECIES: type II toxin-antitoxin system PemK/MazF family toxin [unclassified Microcoleus]|jgi:mRNA interferase MazF|uniref:type II toxin-antitoxin system PemK/MazF family toxin n=1 Tax=unclassified Microcoleus TaxID=2642155 RepID=UPI001DF4045F|nr:MULTISPECIES: type II toxin-antitoxin system PemK/MazF family toxin [unclassified Microcoleus]MCC3420207.1 type II toxin-antitoxin system PemK/MazF family toxin [Microcoleus sp. PH2017_07_MST_O_A]MCC3432472.1 type II toxin-antitoxin system PemK/MazF family toxin [Microcoleus sp. PH2017_04_SCI_O_A]MCC3440798.1 type II toxin-antitoxin system PemK/MazF family toxin [Microcoleus sp. PH2017_03_ELD_O_A]MCC3464955.1 type II toxin-antitoxin system PemK/MazF family toxin [Microcoleus sp. PH2017_06_SF
MNSPDRGEIWLVDLGYIAKVRPCLVVSIPALNQDRALATLVPHTTSLRGSRFEVKVKNKFLREGVFDVQNMITIPHAKLLRKLGSLTSEKMLEVEEVILLWLGFKEDSAEEEEE